MTESAMGQMARGAARVFLSAAGDVRALEEGTAAPADAVVLTMDELRDALARAADTLAASDSRRADVLRRSAGVLPTHLADFAGGIVRSVAPEAPGIVAVVHPDVARRAVRRFAELGTAESAGLA